MFCYNGRGIFAVIFSQAWIHISLVTQVATIILGIMMGIETLHFNKIGL